MSVSRGAAAITLAPGQAAQTTVGAARAGNVRAEASVELASLGGAAYYAFTLRSQANHAAYRARLYFNSAGVPFLAANRVSPSGETVLSTVKLGGPVTLGAWYRLAFTVTGSDPVQIEASLTPGTTASSKPQLVYTDSAAGRIQSAGGIGFWAYASPTAKRATTLRLAGLMVQDGAAPLAPAPSPTADRTAPSSTTMTPAAPAVHPTAAVPTAAPAKPVSPPPAAPSLALAARPAAAASAYGAVPVGNAAYAVPAGALFVAAGAKSGGSGSFASPFASVQDAVNAAKPHATIVLRGGTYHQSVTIPYGKPVTIQAYLHEAVWFDGSRPVTNWTRSGKVWEASGWTAHFSDDMIGQTARFVDSAYPNAARPDQLFIDGTAVTQVASPAQVTVGTFAVDYAHHRLVLGSNPAGHTVEASDLSQAIDSVAAGTTLQGFGVRRYATQYSQMGTVRLQNVDSTARDLVIVDNAMTGLAMTNNNDLAERVTLQRNGQLGLRVTAGYGFVLRDSLITQNDSQRFKPAPESGGVKVTKSRGVTISHNDISGNYATGLWFDQSDYDITVVDNVLDNNGSSTGASNLIVEISAKAVIAGNEMTGGTTGLYVLDSSDVQVYNNDFGGNSFMNVRLLQDHRRQAVATADTAGDRDPRRPAIDPTVPWVTRDITLSNNVFAAGGQFAVYALDNESHRPVDGWNLVITGNVFTNHAAGGPQMVAWGLGDNASQQKYQTPAALAAAKNSRWNNVMVAAAPTTIGAMAASLASVRTTVAVPVPASIAALIGVPVGSQILGVPSACLQRQAEWGSPSAIPTPSPRPPLLLLRVVAAPRRVSPRRTSERGPRPRVRRLERNVAH